MSERKKPANSPADAAVLVLWLDPGLPWDISRDILHSAGARAGQFPLCDRRNDRNLARGLAGRYTLDEEPEDARAEYMGCDCVAQQRNLDLGRRYPERVPTYSARAGLGGPALLRTGVRHIPLRTDQSDHGRELYLLVYWQPGRLAGRADPV